MPNRDSGQKNSDQLQPGLTVHDMSGVLGNTARRSGRPRRLPQKLLDSAPAKAKRPPPTEHVDDDAPAAPVRDVVPTAPPTPPTPPATPPAPPPAAPKRRVESGFVELLLNSFRQFGSGMTGSKRKAPADDASADAQPAKRARAKRGRNSKGMFSAIEVPPIEGPVPDATLPGEGAAPQPRTNFELNDAEMGGTSSSGGSEDASGLAEAEKFVNQQHRRVDLPDANANYANANPATESHSLLTGITADNFLNLTTVHPEPLTTPPAAVSSPPASERSLPPTDPIHIHPTGAMPPPPALGTIVAVAGALGSIPPPSATDLRTPSPVAGSGKKCERQSFTLSVRPSSSDSDVVSRHRSAEYLEKSTEPLQQCSTPLKLRLRPPEGQSSVARPPAYPPLKMRLHLRRSTFPELYTWNLATGTKSDEPMVSSTLVLICSEDPNLFVYHGQDSDEWKIHTPPADIVHWANNDRTGTKRRKRVRIFDMETEKIRAFKSSPVLADLEETLEDRTAKVFTSSISPFKHLARFETAPDKWLKTFVIHKIHLPLKVLRAHMKEFIRPGRTFYWDLNEEDKMKPKRGAMKENTDASCLQKRYEVYHGQDVLRHLGESDHLELIPVSAKTPAHLLHFWDREKSEVVTGDRFAEKKPTLQEVMDEHSDIELYIGQDIHRCFPAIQETIKFHELSSLGLYKQYFSLAYRGAAVTKHVTNQSLIPDNVSLDSIVSESYLFWDLLKSKVVSSEKAFGLLLGDFLRFNEGRFAPYVGQDLSEKAQKQLLKWFDILKWRPGCRGKNMEYMVTGKVNVMLEPVFVPRKRTLEKGTLPRSKTKKSNDRRRRAKPSVPSTKERTKRAKSVETEDEVPGKDVVISDDVSDDDDRDDVNMGRFQGFFVSKRRATELEKYSKSARVPVRHKTSGLVLLPSQSPALANLSIFLKINSDYEIYDRYSCTQEEIDRGKYISHNSDDLQRAKLASGLESNRLLYFANVILSSSIGGALAKEKEELEEELSACGQFADLLDVLCTGELADKGQSLLEILEELDVYNLVTHDEESRLGTSDLMSIRDNMLLGVSFLINDVAQGFREVAAAVMGFHEAGSIMHDDAFILYREGEHAIASFSFENVELMRKDKALFNIRQIVARAEMLLKSSNCDEEIDLSKNNITQRNPYMNNRDENGYSYMSKRQGSKVLGPVMDVHRSYFVDLEREHWLTDSNCHLCGSEVTDVYSNALICANRVYGYCQRIVCRSCICRTATLDDRDFVIVRDAGDWICLHCSGTCKKKHRGCSKKGDAPAPLRQVTFAFQCEEILPSDKVTVAFCERNRNGRFPEEFGENCAMLHVDGKISNKQRNLACGEYRVRISVNNNWYASSLLHVFPVRSFVEPQQSMMKPTVVWKEGSSDGTARVVSLLSDHVLCNSRAEGYNWKAPKRHNVQRWKPEVTGRIPEQLPTIVTTNEESFLPVEDQPVDGNGSLFTSILVKQKKSYEDYSQALMAKKYEKMKNESLWGLVVCRSRIHGSGLFTVTGLGVGDFIIEYAGELIRTPLTDIREAKYFESGLGTYMFTLDKDRCVDATILSNRSRFVNHSCDPNMISQIVKVNGRDLIVLAACRPIPPFSELTFDYQFDIEDGKKKLKCQCKSWNCQGIMN